MAEVSAAIKNGISSFNFSIFENSNGESLPSSTDMPRPYRCVHEGCSKCFVSDVNLNRHINTVHAEKKLCPKCYSYVVDEPQVTEKKGVSGSVQCKKFLYRCSHCRMSFAEFQNSYGRNPNLGKSWFHCDKCKGRFVALRDLNRHYRGHMVYECPHKECAGLEFSALGLKQHSLESHKPEPLSCGNCGKVCASKATLREHVASHMELEVREQFDCPYKDQGCNRKYFYKRNLTKHISYAHNHQAFKCEECGKHLSTKQKLQEHLDAFHKQKTSPLKEPRIVITRPTAVHKMLGIREFTVVGNGYCSKATNKNKNKNKQVEAVKTAEEMPGKPLVTDMNVSSSSTLADCEDSKEAKLPEVCKIPSNFITIVYDDF